MKYDSVFIEKVKAFGMLRYPAHEIIFLVEPEDPAQFTQDFNNPDHELFKAYQQGKISGQYAMDKALFDQGKSNNMDANEKLNQRQRVQRIDTEIYKNFNL